MNPISQSSQCFTTKFYAWFIDCCEYFLSFLIDWLIDWLILSTVGKIAPRGWFPGGSKKWPNTAGQDSIICIHVAWPVDKFTKNVTKLYPLLTSKFMKKKHSPTSQVIDQSNGTDFLRCMKSSPAQCYVQSSWKRGRKRQRIREENVDFLMWKM